MGPVPLLLLSTKGSKSFENKMVCWKKARRSSSFTLNEFRISICCDPWPVKMVKGREPLLLRRNTSSPPINLFAPLSQNSIAFLLIEHLEKGPLNLSVLPEVLWKPCGAFTYTFPVTWVPNWFYEVAKYPYRPCKQDKVIPVGLKSTNWFQTKPRSCEL